MKGMLVILGMTMILSGCGLEMLGSQTAVAKMQKREVDRGRKAHDTTEKQADKVGEAVNEREKKLKEIE